MTIRRARADEAVALTSLAMRSKASHGYDAAFMERVAPLLDFTGIAIEEREIYVLDDGVADRKSGAAGIAGFYRLAPAADGNFLDDLWVDPSSFGRGYGRKLFAHAVDSATTLGWVELLIESDPGAETFYLKMGATRIGERRSGAGRMLPLLRYGLAGKPLRSLV